MTQRLYKEPFSEENAILIDIVLIGVLQWFDEFDGFIEDVGTFAEEFKVD
jgi:hypothetical protein